MTGATWNGRPSVRVVSVEQADVMTPPTLPTVPNKPKTPQRTIRISDTLWAKAKARADERGETLTEAIRRFLERYCR